MFRVIWAAVVALCLLGIAQGIQAAPSQTAAAAGVMVGDPKNPGALAQAVQTAYQSGARHVAIRPGVYLLPKTGHTDFLLDGWQDATLSAYGVTLISSENEWGHDLIGFHHCTHVTLAGPTLSQTGLTFYQGRVVATGTDSGKFYADWKPDAGYPVPSADTVKFSGAANVVDAHTRRLKVGTGDYYDLPLATQPAGIFRFQFREPMLNIAVGDWLVGRWGGAGFKVFLDDSRDCVVRDVTMMRNGFANVREDNGGGNHFLHCIWALGPRPAGATEDPIVTNQADGFHSTGTNPGPDIENCVFRGVFLDDCIAIHGSLQTVQSTAGNVLTLKGGIGSLQVGQPVRISDDKGFFAEAVVATLHDNGGQTTAVTLDKDLGVPAGAKLSNPLRDGAGYRIIGCHLGGTRSRGILVKSDNGLIQNNVIEGCGMSAVSIGPEYYWGEADYARHVVVSGNTFTGNGQAGYGGATVLVHGDGAIGNRDIVIKGNQFVSNYQGDIDVQWADGVALTDNTFTAPSRWLGGGKPRTPIALADCRAITLNANRVTKPAAYAPGLVTQGKDVTGLKP